jgi:hypothetical protein
MTSYSVKQGLDGLYDIWSEKLACGGETKMVSWGYDSIYTAKCVIDNIKKHNKEKEIKS